jgi:hypothetical protein
LSSGDATVQLLDLNEAAIAPATRPARTLRVLAKLRIGGLEMPLTGDQRILPAGTILGRAPASDGTWVGNELYLGTLWVDGDGRRFQYDVLLERKTKESDQSPSGTP